MYPFELWFSPDICPGVGLLDHMVALFLVFKGTFILFSTVAVPIYIPTNSVGGFLKKVEVELPYDPAIPLLGTNPKKPKTLI